MAGWLLPDEPDLDTGLRCADCAPPTDRTADRCGICPWADHEPEPTDDDTAALVATADPGPFVFAAPHPGDPT
jgi:hypothetical protein